MAIIAILMWLAFTIPACFILANKHRDASYYILAVFLPLIGLIVALCLNKLPIDPREKGTRSTLFMAFVVMVSTILYAMLVAHVQDPFPDIDPTRTPIFAALISSVVFTVPACFILDHKHRGAGYYVLAGFFPLIGLIVALCLKKLPAEEQHQIQAVDLDITKETRKK